MNWNKGTQVQDKAAARELQKKDVPFGYTESSSKALKKCKIGLEIMKSLPHRVPHHFKKPKQFHSSSQLQSTIEVSVNMHLWWSKPILPHSLLAQKYTRTGTLL